MRHPHSSEYLGLAIDRASTGDHFMARSCLIAALRVAGDDAASVLEEAQSWAKALPTLENVIRLNRERLERLAEVTA